MGGWPGGRVAGWPGGWITLGIMQTQPPTELELGLGLSLAIKSRHILGHGIILGIAKKL